MPKSETLDKRYPHLSRFLAIQGWIKVGADEYSTSFVRALDSGGMIDEKQESYAALDSALADLNQGVKDLQRSMASSHKPLWALHSMQASPA